MEILKKHNYTVEEQLNRDKAKALTLVPIYAMNALACVVSSRAKDVTDVLKREKRAYSIIRDYSPDKKVMYRVDQVRGGICRFYEELCVYIDDMERIMFSEDGLAASNDEALRIADPHLDAIRSAIMQEMSGVRPLEPRLFFDVVTLLYLNALFVNYRKTFSQELGTRSMSVFRKLDIYPDIKKLANELQMEDRDGGIIRFTYDRQERELWESLSGRRSYKGVDIRRMHLVDLQRSFDNDVIDRQSYELVRDLFGYESLDRIMEAGEGRSLDFTHRFQSESYFGCMNTYEQYAFVISMKARRLGEAKKWMVKLKEMYSIDEMVCAYDNQSGAGEFRGIWPNADIASVETGTEASRIVSISDKNGEIHPGVQVSLHIDEHKYSFFRGAALDRMLNSINI